MHPLLLDDDWVEDHVALSAEQIAEMLGVALNDAQQALVRVNPKLRARTDVEDQAARDLYGRWGATLLSRATGRSLWGWYGIGRRLKLKAPQLGFGRSHPEDKFWTEWQGYVAERVGSFREISRRVVLSPRKDGLECSNCKHRATCDWRSVVACEDYTLEDALGNDAFKKRDVVLGEGGSEAQPSRDGQEQRRGHQG